MCRKLVTHCSRKGTGDKGSSMACSIICFPHFAPSQKENKLQTNIPWAPTHARLATILDRPLILVSSMMRDPANIFKEGHASRDIILPSSCHLFVGRRLASSLTARLDPAEGPGANKGGLFTVSTSCPEALEMLPRLNS